MKVGIQKIPKNFFFVSFENYSKTTYTEDDRCYLQFTLNY